MVELAEISRCVQSGKAKDVEALVSLAIEEQYSPKEILEDGLLSGMRSIGERFKKNEVFVPEVLIASRAMHMGFAILKPIIRSSDVQYKGVVVIGTVKGDLHNIGKNLVAMMMEGAGLKVVDLGTDVSHEKFVEEAIIHKADILACSALLTTTMMQMKTVIQAVTAAGLREKLKIMVGGAPVTENFCRSVGADVYTPDAATAAEQALALCSKKRIKK
ncbi:cobalamin B12-binding domain-containing protein [Breznakiella homolactica]|uniref:Corrinoid protein n=1 Tax=Breznakiella homolactica TaxID=2798577 RepID=A0A7T7XQ96_9SPIR|nr:corrinoid protein [Breznakiella homolactica]QQO10497.1 corrinoid protein [Breznakiella homolactica]